VRVLLEQVGAAKYAPDCNRYRSTRLRPVHANCTVEVVSVEPGVGAISSAATSAVVAAVCR
jgi:hypothetical protein